MIELPEALARADELKSELKGKRAGKGRESLAAVFSAQVLLV